MAERTKNPVTEKASPDAVETQDVSSAASPAAIGGVWDALHQGIGNQAIGRMVEAQRAASSEAPTRVSPQQQRQIDSSRGAGEALEGAPGVRMHYGEDAQALSRGLNARAFTQGSDIFFGEGYDPQSEQGQATLAHELTHAAGGEAMAGTVQREPNQSVQPKAAPEPNASVAPPAAPNQSKVQLYSLETSEGLKDNLTKNQALAIMLKAFMDTMNGAESLKGEWTIVSHERMTFWGGLGADIVDFSGMDFPQYKELLAPVESARIKADFELKAGHMVQAAAAMNEYNRVYTKSYETWDAYKNQLEGAKNTSYVLIGVASILAIIGAAVILADAEVVAGAEVVSEATSTAEATTTTAEATSTTAEATSTTAEATSTTTEATTTTAESTTEATSTEASSSEASSASDANATQKVEGQSGSLNAEEVAEREAALQALDAEAAEGMGQTANALKTGGADAAAAVADSLDPMVVQEMWLAVEQGLANGGETYIAERAFYEELAEILHMAVKRSMGL